jgi:hypothetical protein
MKRILAITLALILVLSCCPNVYATEAEEELGYSEALANMDPKIKEIIASQMSQEEKDALVALDPSLEDALLLKVFSLSMQFYRDEYYGEKTIDAIVNTKSVGKIDDGLFQAITPGRRFSIGELTINPISISHDAADPVAYKVINGDKKVAVVTDLGNYNQAIVDELQGLDALLLEANHDIKMLQMGAYPYPLKRRILGDRGHLSNERSGQLLSELLHDDFGTVVLGHLSKENNYEELAYEAVRLEVTMGDNPYKAEDFPMYVAKRDNVSPMIRV